MNSRDTEEMEALRGRAAVLDDVITRARWSGQGRQSIANVLRRIEKTVERHLNELGPEIKRERFGEERGK